MCLLFCFVLFWILCCVVCEKINKKLLITKSNNGLVTWFINTDTWFWCSTMLFFGYWTTGEKDEGHLPKVTAEINKPLPTGLVWASYLWKDCH